MAEWRIFRPNTPVRKTAFRNRSRRPACQAELHQRKIDAAHRRFLSAVRTLAQIRKLALPNLQVNIGQNQVNVAGQ